MPSLPEWRHTREKPYIQESQKEKENDILYNYKQITKELQLQMIEKIEKMIKRV